MPLSIDTLVVDSIALLHKYLKPLQALEKMLICFGLSGGDGVESVILSLCVDMDNKPFYLYLHIAQETPGQCLGEGLIILNGISKSSLFSISVVFSSCMNLPDKLITAWVSGGYLEPHLTDGIRMALLKPHRHVHEGKLPRPASVGTNLLAVHATGLGGSSVSLQSMESYASGKGKGPQYWPNISNTLVDQWHNHVTSYWSAGVVQERSKGGRTALD